MTHRRIAGTRTGAVAAPGVRPDDCAQGWVRRVAAAVVTATFLASTAGPLAAGDPPTPAPPPAAPPGPAAKATADPVEADIEALRKLVREQQWARGADLARAILTRHTGDLRLLARVHEIETDLRTCLWRLARKEPNLAELIGCGAVKVDGFMRNAEFRFDGLRAGSGWSGSGQVFVFDIPFDEATVTCTLRGWWPTLVRVGHPPAIVLHYDSEREGGYGFTFRFEHTPLRSAGGGRLGVSGGIRRWGEKGDELVAHGVPGFPALDDDMVYECSEVAGILRARLGKTTLASKQDSVHRNGLIAVVGVPEAIACVSRLTLTGKISETYLRRIRSEHEDAARREWLAKSWHREDQIPAWVIQAEREALFRRAQLPGDASDEQQRWFREKWDLLIARDRATIAAVTRWLDGAPPLTSQYIRAILLVHRREYGAARMNLAAVCEAQPGFGPAWALSALAARLGGNDEPAGRALEAALERADYHPWTWEVAAARALDDGDFAAAQKALDDAVAHQAGSPALSELRSVLMRIRRGPDWVKRYQAESAHFVVASDHGQAVCTEILAMLDEARRAYETQFRKPPRSDGRKARVYVFSGRASYEAYAADSGSDVEDTLGVYRPRLRELLVFLHEDRRMLKDTVRHEAFHQYLHRFLDDVPVWFNEGTAEWFGFSRKKDGKFMGGQAGALQSVMVAVHRRSFVGLERLFLMDHPAFMENPGPNYVQSWAVIQFLRQTKDPRFAGLHDRYLDALLAGKSGEDACAEVMKPVIPALERAMGTWLDTLQEK